MTYDERQRIAALAYKLIEAWVTDKTGRPFVQECEKLRLCLQPEPGGNDLGYKLACAVSKLRDCKHADQPMLFAARLYNVEDAVKRLRQFVSEPQPKPSGEDEDIDPIAESQRLDGRIDEVVRQFADLDAESWRGHGRGHDRLDQQLAELAERVNEVRQACDAKTGAGDEWHDGAEKTFAELAEQVAALQKAFCNNDTAIAKYGRQLDGLEVGATVQDKQCAAIAEHMNAIDKCFDSMPLAPVYERLEVLDGRVQGLVDHLTQRIDDVSLAPAPKAACEHLRTHAVSIWGSSAEPVSAPGCDDCSSILLSGTWYTAQPSNEMPPKAACEHPKEKVTIESIVLRGGMMKTEVCECGAIYAGRWYTPEPPSSVEPKAPCDHSSTELFEPIWLWHPTDRCKFCKAVRMGGAWYIPQRPTEKADGGD